MEKLADISQFEALMNVSGNQGFCVHNPITVENSPFDASVPPLVPPVSSAEKSGDRNAIPEWGKSLSDRVNGLETRIGGLETRIGGLETRMSRVEANMATKADIQQINAKLEQLIQSR